MKTNLDYVLAYSHKSYSVIPIVGKDKKPAIQSWESNQGLFRKNYISAKGYAASSPSKIIGAKRRR